MAEKGNFEQLNKDVAGWARYQTQQMRRRVGSLTLKDKHALYKAARHQAKDPEYRLLEKSIGAAVKADPVDLQVSRINFRFPKQGIYLEHGVGRGRPVRSAFARPKPWIAPVLDSALDKLAGLVASNYADIAADEIKFFIPGIINRRIKIDNG